MAGQPGGLDPRPHVGRTPCLSDQDLDRLEQLLAQGALAHGWPNQLWTAARVARLISQHFGIEHHPEHVRKILKQRLGWTSQKPEHHHRDRDDVAIQRWVRESFPCILNAAKAKGAHLIFVDEAGFMLEPTVRRTYAPRGKTPINRISNPHSRISAIGAIVINTVRYSIDLLYGLLPDNLNYQGPTVVQFFRTLRSGILGPMTIVWDRIPIHECEDVAEYLAEDQNMVVEPFPPHAPELNPADGIWRYVKYGRLPNYTPLDLDVLRAKIMDELNRLKGNVDLLRSFVRFTRLPIDL
jgi:transposase